MNNKAMDHELARGTLLANLGKSIADVWFKRFTNIWIKQEILQGVFHNFLDQGFELVDGEIFDLHK